jgi:hypothetical protein
VRTLFAADAKAVIDTNIVRCPMAWYRCSCGHVSKQTPLFGEIVSVYHLHHSRRVDGSATLELMERIPDDVAAMPAPALIAAPAAAPEPVAAGR